MTEKINQITIMAATVFDKEVRQVGDVVDVTDATRADAEAIIRRGRAVAGVRKIPTAQTVNKAVAETATR